MGIREALLQLLAEGDRRGYQLKVNFEARTGGIWPLNVGQVYSTLDRLVRDGRVVEAGNGAAGGDGSDSADHKSYRLTEEGRGDLKAWLSASAVDTVPPRDDLIMKILLAVGASPSEALAVIDEQRSALLLALQVGRRQQRGRTHVGSDADRLAHDAVLTRIEADVRWLDRCEEFLRAATATRRTP